MSVRLLILSSVKVRRRHLQKVLKKNIDIYLCFKIVLKLWTYLRKQNIINEFFNLNLEYNARCGFLQKCPPNKMDPGMASYGLGKEGGYGSDQLHGTAILCTEIERLLPLVVSPQKSNKFSVELETMVSHETPCWLTVDELKV